MAHTTEHGYFFGSHELPRGPRVRLRLAQSRDLPAVRALLGADRLEELELARLVHPDPRRRVVICATALIGLSERVLGIGAIDVDAAEPDVLLVDRELTDGLDELLATVLVARARTIAAKARAA